MLYYAKMISAFKTIAFTLMLATVFGNPSVVLAQENVTSRDVQKLNPSYLFTGSETYVGLLTEDNYLEFPNGIYLKGPKDLQSYVPSVMFSISRVDEIVKADPPEFEGARLGPVYLISTFDAFRMHSGSLEIGLPLPELLCGEAIGLYQMTIDFVSAMDGGNQVEFLWTNLNVELNDLDTHVILRRDEFLGDKIVSIYKYDKEGANCQ